MDQIKPTIELIGCRKGNVTVIYVLLEKPSNGEKIAHLSPATESMSFEPEYFPLRMFHCRNNSLQSSFITGAQQL